VVENQSIAIYAHDVSIKKLILENVVKKQSTEIQMKELIKRNNNKITSARMESRQFLSPENESNSINETYEKVSLMKIKKEQSEGSSQSNKIAIFIHGLNENGTIYKDIGITFANHGYEVHSIDLPGFGKLHDGGRGKWHGNNVLLNYVWDYICHVMRENPNAEITLCGESMGGAILNCLSEKIDNTPNITMVIKLSPAVRPKLSLFKGLFNGSLIYNPFHKKVDEIVEYQQKIDPYHKTVLSAGMFNFLDAYFYGGEPFQSLLSLMGLAGKSYFSATKVIEVFGSKDQMIPAEQFFKNFHLNRLGVKHPFCASAIPL